MEGHYFEAVGRRKTATARVRLYSGNGQILVNGRSVGDYFRRDSDLLHLREPLETVGMSQNFDISVLVKGGGIRGQAGAIRHGVARAMLVADPDLRGQLRQGGFLTRDARAKERKKPGLKRARKAPQYTKR